MKRNKKLILYRSLFFLFVFIAAVPIVNWIIRIGIEKNASDELNKLNELASLQAAGIGTDNSDSERVEDAYESDDTAPVDRFFTATGVTVPKLTIDWEGLHGVSENIYAWIYIPNTEVYYPVLQHPTDNEYYLRYNLNGTKGHPGCIYSENYNKTDFSDYHTVLYGHTLVEKDIASMFTTLHDFEDEEFFNKTDYVFIYTEDYTYIYKIFGAYEYNANHLLLNYDYSNREQYALFLNSIYNFHGRVDNFKRDVNVTTSDRILTLSTCTTDYDFSLRYLVSAVLMNPRDEWSVYEE